MSVALPPLHELAASSRPLKLRRHFAKKHPELVAFLEAPQRAASAAASAAAASAENAKSAPIALSLAAASSLQKFIKEVSNLRL